MCQNVQAAMAYLCGVKTSHQTTGVSVAAWFNQCNTTHGNEVTSVMNRAERAGSQCGGVGVATTRVQHASLSDTYMHTVNQNWYSGANMPAWALKEGYQDITMQLISNMDTDVILGGSRKYIFPKGTPDPKFPGDARESGVRMERQNLGQKCQAKHQGARYVWNHTALI